MARRGLEILEVESGSPAEEIGLEPGDRILAVDGREVPDELALQFQLSEEYVDLHIRKRSGEEQRLEADLSDCAALGVKVEEFRTRTCSNACLFCFVNQLPPRVRPSLKIKDDDYRLSFLHGNYVTLTNVTDRDLNRIIEQRLSPLYVSVHATDPELRTRMLGRKKPDDLDRKLRRLTGGGIRIHAQIVLMPGINDGPHLKKTVFDLYRLYPGIQSVAVVPLGLSDHGSIRSRFSAVTRAFCRALITQVQPWQEAFRTETGKTFAYLGDEFYLRAGEDLPETSHYDDFAQIEDGVGMVRDFMDEFEGEMRRRRRHLSGVRVTLATGRLFFPSLQGCIERLNEKFGSSLQVCTVENRFMGKSITVAGLLAGQDFLSALKRKDLGNFLVIPQDAVSRVDGILLDDLSPDDLSRALGVPVFPGGRTVRDFFQLLARLARG